MSQVPPESLKTLPPYPVLHTCTAHHPDNEKWTCDKPEEHKEAEHAACLGYHPDWMDDNGLMHEGEWEWVVWTD